MITEMIFALILLIKDRQDMRQKMEENELKLKKFMPMDFYKLFGTDKMENVSGACVGKHRKTEGAFLYTDIKDYREQMLRMTDKEIYDVINEMLYCAVPAVQNRGGLVAEYTDAGVYAMFPDKSEDALNAAITLSVAVAEREQKLAGLQDRFGIGLCYGEALTGITGYGERHHMRTFSNCEEQARFLHETAVKYGLRILMTEKLADRIEGFEEKYENRFVGYLYVSKGGYLEKVYEVLEGDNAVSRDLKKRTKDTFEQGIRLFLEQKWTEAREYFVGVLKVNVEDKMAKKYLKLCDAYVEDSSDVKLHIMEM